MKFVKESTRKEILRLRLEMSCEDFHRKSVMVQSRFLELKEFKTAKRVALYVSFKNEVLTESICEEAITEGKEVFFPKISKGRKRLLFAMAEKKEDFSKGAYGVPEPGGLSMMGELSDIDLIVVPGVAFDLEGNRLGYGRGYYDTTLKTVCCLTVGLAYEFQVLDSICSESHDVKMDKVITESRIIDLH